MVDAHHRVLVLGEKGGRITGEFRSQSQVCSAEKRSVDVPVAKSMGEPDEESQATYVASGGDLCKERRQAFESLTNVVLSASSIKPQSKNEINGVQETQNRGPGGRMGPLLGRHPSLCGTERTVFPVPQEVEVTPFGKVTPAYRARIARSISLTCSQEVPTLGEIVLPEPEERALLRSMRSIQQSGFLVDNSEAISAEVFVGEEPPVEKGGRQDLDDGSSLVKRTTADGLDALRALQEAEGFPKGLDSHTARTRSGLGSSEKAQRAGLQLARAPFQQKTDSMTADLVRDPTSSKQQSEAGSEGFYTPVSCSDQLPPSTAKHGRSDSHKSANQQHTDRIRTLPQVTVLPIIAEFDTVNHSPYTPSPLKICSPATVRRTLTDIPEEPISCPNSPKGFLNTLPLKRRHSLSDTPRPVIPSKLRRSSFSEAPTFARELLRATSLSACQEPHEGPCFSSQMIDALVLSRAVYETKLADMLFYMSFSSAELPCGAFELVLHRNMEKVRDGKKVHRRLSAQPYVVVKSSHGHFLVGCRGTDCFPDMVQDLQLVHKRFLGLGAAHWGFVQRAHSIDIQPLLDLLAAGEHIVLTGHSMGGAVAALLTLRLMEATRNEVRSQLQCITFGCPLFANGDLADHINTEYKDLFVHILAKHDAVPRMVPLLAGLFNLAMGSTRGDHPLDALAAVDFAIKLLKPSPLGPLAVGIKALMNGVGGVVPRRIRGLLKGVIRVALPPYSAIYAAAGHMVVLDRESKAFMPFYSELKSIKCQLGFALGMTNPDLLREHEISYYVTHVGQFTQPWLEKFGCVSAGVCVDRARRGALQRRASLEASVGIGTPEGLNTGVGFGVGLRSGGRIPGCELGLDLDCRLQMQKRKLKSSPKLKPSSGSLCLDRLFDSEEELAGMVNGAPDFNTIPESSLVRVVTPTTRRKMRLRATCTVSFKCRGLVGLPAEEVEAKPRKKRGVMRCFGFMKHVGRITRVAKSFEDVCLAYTSFRLLTLVVTHFV